MKILTSIPVIYKWESPHPETQKSCVLQNRGINDLKDGLINKLSVFCVCRARGGGAEGGVGGCRAVERGKKNLYDQPRGSLFQQCMDNLINQ